MEVTASTVTTTYSGYRYTAAAAEETETLSFTDALQSAAKEEPKTEQLESLGIGFLFVGSMGYGMSASEVVGADSPTVRVKLTFGQSDTDSYDIDLSKVNPRKATAIEIFAYCQYADAHGMGVNNTFGSWNAMKTIVSPLGQTLEFSSVEEALTKKMDWNSALAESSVGLEQIRTGATVSAKDLLRLLSEMHEKTAQDEDAEDWREMNDEDWEKFLAGIDGQLEQLRESARAEAAKRLGKTEETETLSAERLKEIVEENKASGKIRPAMSGEEFIRMQQEIIRENQRKLLF